jgi:hypothetical protein
MIHATFNSSSLVWTRATTVIALAFVSLPAMLGAQASQHRLVQGDTLRWREVRTTKSSMEMGPDLNMRTEMSQRGTLGLVRTLGDTVVAWYDSLSAEFASPEQNIRMPVPLSNKTPVRMLIADNWRVQPLAGDLAALQASMVPSQFMSQGVPMIPPVQSLLMRLPSAPLAIGVTWSDSTVASDMVQVAALGVTISGGTAYRVVRDTTVDDRQGFVISFDLTSRASADAGAPKSPLLGNFEMTMGEKGIIVFDPLAGRMIGRRISGVMRTAMKVPSPDGGARDVITTANFDYSLELVRP